MLACLLVGLALLSLTVHAPGPDCTDVQLTEHLGNWVPLKSPRYGSRCPWTKARYNCELFHYKHLKWVPSVSHETCTFVEHDPVSSVRARRARVPGTPKRPLLLAIVGDSHVRQHLHSLACRFAHLVSRRIVLYNGRLMEFYGRCHGGNMLVNPQLFYCDPPFGNYTCTDDEVFMQFGDELQFLSKWRSGNLAMMSHIAEAAGVRDYPHSVDVILTNVDGEGFKNELRQLKWNGTFVRFGGRGRQNQRELTLSLPYSRIDARATNKAVCSDHHWCSPGPFDDSVSLLLAMIANPTAFGPDVQLDKVLFRQVKSSFKRYSCRGRPHVGVYGEGLISKIHFGVWKNDSRCRKFVPRFGPNETRDGFTFFPLDPRPPDDRQNDTAEERRPVGPAPQAANTTSVAADADANATAVDDDVG